MNRKELENYLAVKGFIADKYGFYKSKIQKMLIRFKFQKNVVRCEVRDNTTNTWVEVWVEYYTNLKLNEKGVLTKFKEG